MNRARDISNSDNRDEAVDSAPRDAAGLPEATRPRAQGRFDARPTFSLLTESVVLLLVFGVAWRGVVIGTATGFLLWPQRRSTGDHGMAPSLFGRSRSSPWWDGPPTVSADPRSDGEPLVGALAHHSRSIAPPVDPSSGWGDWGESSTMSLPRVPRGCLRAPSTSFERTSVRSFSEPLSSHSASVERSPDPLTRGSNWESVPALRGRIHRRPTRETPSVGTRECPTKGSIH